MLTYADACWRMQVLQDVHTTQPAVRACGLRYSVYWLYWYKSTNIDAICITGPLLVRASDRIPYPPLFNSYQRVNRFFSSSLFSSRHEAVEECPVPPPLQLLPACEQVIFPCLVYLLYWYK
jgi:hypothetical protein